MQLYTMYEGDLKSYPRNECESPLHKTLTSLSSNLHLFLKLNNFSRGSDFPQITR